MESKEPTQEKIIEAVKKYYGLTIDENAYGSADVYAYEETTADGYSVYCAISVIVIPSKPK